MEINIKLDAKLKMRDGIAELRLPTMFRILPGTKMVQERISSTLSAASMEMAGDSACAALPVTWPSSWCATRASIPVGRTSNKLNRHILKRGQGPSSRLPGPERNRRPASPGDGPAGQDICAYAEAASRRVRTDTHLAWPVQRKPMRLECNGTGERRRSDGDLGEPSNGVGARAGGV